MIEHITTLKIPATIAKFFFIFLGAIWAVVEPQIPFMLICTLAVLMDCYTAWQLGRRVRKKYPDKADGKFKSEHAGRVFVTLLKIYSLIILAAFIQRYIFEDMPIRLTNIVSGAICFWQIWSMLENESSCNNSRWAKVLQRIMVDKTERHFDVDLHEFKDGSLARKDIPEEDRPKDAPPSRPHHGPDFEDHHHHPHPEPHFDEDDNGRY